MATSCKDDVKGAHSIRDWRGVERFGAAASSEAQSGYPPTSPGFLQRTEQRSADSNGTSGSKDFLDTLQESSVDPEEDTVGQGPEADFDKNNLDLEPLNLLEEVILAHECISDPPPPSEIRQSPKPRPKKSRLKFRKFFRSFGRNRATMSDTKDGQATVAGEKEGNNNFQVQVVLISHGGI